jgi:hypothetical protein
MLPSLGSVGIQLDTGKYSGNGVPTRIHLLGVVPTRLHILGAINFALCIRGTCGKGTLRTYPSFRVSTHPFRVLCRVARGSSKGEFFNVQIIRSYCRVMSPGVVFALVAHKIFHSKVPFKQKYFLCVFFACPEILHFHCLQYLAFNGVIRDADCCHIVAVYRYCWLGMSKVFEGGIKNHPLLAIHK